MLDSSHADLTLKIVLAEAFSLLHNGGAHAGAGWHDQLRGS